MKVVFTGGGTGGHFYPHIAVIEELQKSAIRVGVKDLSLFYFSTSAYNQDLLDKHGVVFKKIPAGKQRSYKSIKNFLDLWVVFYGLWVAVFKLFLLYPDVVFSKGGYAAFPTVFAARILAIPVVVHESDTIPGRVNKWTGKFAKKVAVSWPEAALLFPEEKTAVTGQPIREEISTPVRDGAFQVLGFPADADTRPTIAVFGGSQGAQAINDIILDILPELLKTYNVIHQTGPANYEDVSARAEIILEKWEYIPYKAFPILGPEYMVRTAGVSDLIISRSGSFIFEMANWGIPAILIPLPEDVSHDQRENAFSYARTGSASVIEQANLTPAILQAEITKILNSELKKTMRENALAFASLDAAIKISEAILNIAIEHDDV